MNPSTILLVDYDPRSNDRIRRLLEWAGYRVEIATNGLEAMESFGRVRPDLMLIEPLIPKKHGFEVCRELKKTADGQRTPIVVLTGVYTTRTHRTRALHLHGFDDHVVKPIADEALLETIERRLKNRPAAGIVDPRGTNPAKPKRASRSA